jgi:hypothetical protein
MMISRTAADNAYQASWKLPYNPDSELTRGEIRSRLFVVRNAAIALTTATAPVSRKNS